MGRQCISLGIDPGRKGGYAMLDPNGDILDAGDLPYGYDGLNQDRLNGPVMAELVRQLFTRLPDLVSRVFAIEHPLARSGESDWGHLRSGTNFGKLIMLAEISDADAVYTPMPHTWKQNMRLSADKTQSVERAELLFPEFTGFRGPRGGLRDGIAEAALIAEWGRRKFCSFQTDEEGMIRRPSRTEPEPLAGVVREVIKPAELQAFKDRRGW